MSFLTDCECGWRGQGDCPTCSTKTNERKQQTAADAAKEASERLALAAEHSRIVQAVLLAADPDAKALQPAGTTPYGAFVVFEGKPYQITASGPDASIDECLGFSIRAGTPPDHPLHAIWRDGLKAYLLQVARIGNAQYLPESYKNHLLKMASW